MKSLMMVGILCVVMGMSTCAQAFIVINEILADPASGLSGDANGDGVRSTANDEFIELMNYGTEHVNIGGWSLSDKTKVRHIFPVNTIVDPFSFFIIFGGGDPMLGSLVWQKASTGGLGLNNGGDTVTLWDADVKQVDQVIYRGEGGDNQSLVREEDGVGLVFAKHSIVDNKDHKLFSPGEYSITTDNDLDKGITNAVVPEPSTMMMFALGMSMGFRKMFGFVT